MIIIHLMDIQMGIFKIKASLTPVNVSHTRLLYIGMTLAYITTYSGMEVDSPSLVIIKIISENNKEGITQEDLYKILNDEILVKPRVNDLLLDNMAYKIDEKYFTTIKGANMAKLFNLYRRILNVSNPSG